MLKIRIDLVGKRNKRFFHIIVIDSRKKRNGMYLEKIGWYDPHSKINNKFFDLNRFEYWKSKGAQATERVIKILADFKKDEN